MLFLEEMSSNIKLNVNQITFEHFCSEKWIILDVLSQWCTIHTLNMTWTGFLCCKMRHLIAGNVQSEK